MCLKSCFKSCLCAEKYIPGLAWLHIVTADEHLHGMHQRCPKQCRAFGQQPPTHFWWQPGESNCKVTWKCVCTWTKLTLLCFLACMMWLFDCWARKKARLLLRLYRFYIYVRVKLALIIYILKGLAPLALQADVCLEGRGNQSWKTDSKSCLLS